MFRVKEFKQTGALRGEVIYRILGVRTPNDSPYKNHTVYSMPSVQSATMSITVTIFLCLQISSYYCCPQLQFSAAKPPRWLTVSDVGLGFEELETFFEAGGTVRDPGITGPRAKFGAEKPERDATNCHNVP